MNHLADARDWITQRARAGWQSALDVGEARVLGEDIAVPLVRVSGFAGIGVPQEEGPASGGGGVARAVPLALLLFPKEGAPRIELLGEEDSIPALLARVEDLEEKLAARLEARGRSLDPKAALALAKLRLAGLEDHF